MQTMEGLKGKEESLYIQCLFRTINFADLKQELKNRTDGAVDNSYFIMTLKLRLHILQKASCNVKLQDELKTEIEGLDRKPPRGYKCSIAGCKYNTRNFNLLLGHLRSLHSSREHKIICQLNGCERELSSVRMLQIHIRTCHRTRKSSVLLKQNQLAEQLSRLRCPAVSCGHQQSTTLKDLKSHIISEHTDKMEEVDCIYAGCNFKSHKTGTLRSHFSRKHPSQLIDDVKKELVVSSGDDDQLAFKNSGTTFGRVDTENELDDDGSNSDCLGVTLDNTDIEFEEEEEDDNAQEVFTRALAMQFNSWMNVKNIAYSTVNEIVTEIFNSYQQGVTVTKDRIKKHLEIDGWDSSKIWELLSKIDLEDPFKEARGSLENETKRKTYIQSEFDYAKPVTIRLNETNRNEKPETMQYIPIKESLKILLEDESYISQKNNNPYFHEPGVIKDVKDGLTYRTNKFFTENPEAVPIILFADELEVVNPLGAGKTKHKIQCCYYTTVDIIPPLRCKVKSTQLCSLVLSSNWKKHGNEACNRQLVIDLKDLEKVGIEINKPSKKVVKAGLCLIVGDNLGQNQLGEFSSCFSSGFICRVCDANYKDVCKNRQVYSESVDDYKTEILTKDKYDQCATLAVESGASDETLGIKGHCIFNGLESFHCVDQLAPCLGHDFYEGIFAYDVQFFLDYLITKEKLIGAEEFNERLRNVRLSSRDAKNRPKCFKHKKGQTKYEGNAGSLRILSRILTTILSGVLEQSVTEKLIIKLHELSEIITAPVLTVHEVKVEMEEIVVEYLDLRIEAVETLEMPNPRPKHHFISHYPRAFLNNGPLIAIWAMRLESKHTFFKSVLRTAKNFKNVAFTCANRHQLAQVSYAFYGLFSTNKHEIPDNAPMASDVAKITSDPALKAFYQELNEEAVIPNRVKIYGTEFIIGKIIVIKKQDHGNLKVGLIKAISYFKNKISFAVVTFEALKSKFGPFVTTAFISAHEVVDFDTLADYYPLEMMGTLDSFSFILHHYVTRGSGDLSY